MCRLIQIYILLLLGMQNTFSQVYQTYSFTENNGLSSYNVHKICQDKYGFSWIATQDGLNKFDGKDFQQYNKFSTPGLSGNDIRDVTYDSINDIIWVSSSNGGVDGLSSEGDKILYQLPIDRIKSLLPDPSVQQIVIIEKSVIALNTPSGVLIYNFIKNKIIPLAYQPFSNLDKGNKFIIGLFTFNNRLITITLNYGISIYNTHNYKIEHEISFGRELKEELIYKSCIDQKNGVIYIPTSSGIYKYMISNNTIQKIYNAGKTIFCVNQISDSSFLFATPYGIFTSNIYFNRILPIKFTSDIAAVNWQNEVNTIFQDREKRIWYGARKGLIIQSKKATPFEKFGTDNASGIKLNHLYYITFLSNSKVLACDIKGLYIIDLLTGSINAVENEKVYYYLFEIAGVKKGKFISTDKGLYITSNFEKPTFEPAGLYYPELKPVEKYIFNSHIVLNDSIIVLTTEGDKGTVIWDRKNTRVINLNEKIKLSSNFTNGVAKVSDSSFLLATDSEAGIYYIKSNKFDEIEIYDDQKHKLRLFMDVAVINNNYWIASYGSGIFIYNRSLQKIASINSKNGLSNNGVYKIIKEKNNMVWATTNYGLTRINVANNTISTYFNKDGLNNNAFEEFSANYQNGIIIAGGPNGFTKIDPDKINKPETPKKIVFDYLQISDTDTMYKINLLTVQKTKIPNNASKVDIHIASLNFDLSSKNVYYYNIKELNSSWFVSSDNSSISLIGLSPGTYHLQVKASNEEGVSSEPKELILEFLPKWYQTWWFKLLIFLTTAGIIYAFYRYRITQIKKQHEIRKNIATDLHDDLGSTLNSVKVFTNLAISGVKQEESLQQIKDNLNEATMGLRDMIWVLDDSLDTVDELVTRLKQFALPVAAASNIQAEIKAESEVSNLKLTKEEKRNLFLVCKEGINNSIKYSGATQINVEIKPAGKKIQVRITDNGKGFNVDEVKKGYGLKNMQYRAGQIKYKAELASSPGKGTHIEIKSI